MTRARATRGDRFMADVLERFELRPDEMVVLEEIGATLNVLAALPDGALVEARQNRLVLARLLGLLALSDDAGAPRPSVDGKSIRGRHAAEARWRRERAQTT
jgi:hypothetical protein